MIFYSLVKGQKDDSLSASTTSLNSVLVAKTQQLQGVTAEDTSRLSLPNAEKLKELPKAALSPLTLLKSKILNNAAQKIGGLKAVPKYSGDVGLTYGMMTGGAMGSQINQVATLSAGVKTELFGLPVNVHFRLVNQNGITKADFSGLDFNFDANALSQKLKGQIIGNDYEHLMDKMLKSKDMSFQGLKDSLNKLEEYKTLLTSPDYYKVLQTLEDSVKVLTKDSVAKFKGDTTAVSALKKDIAEMKAVKDSFYQMQSYLQENKKRITEYEHVLSDYKNKLSNLPVQALDSLTGKFSLTKLQKVFLAIKKFKLGRQIIDQSDLTLRNLPLTGLSTEVQHRNFYTGIIVGSNSNVNPNMMNLFTQTIAQRSVNINWGSMMIGAVSVGFGPKDRDHVHGFVSYARQVQAPAAGVIDTFFRPSLFQDMLVGIQARKVFFKSILADAEVASSYWTKDKQWSKLTEAGSASRLIPAARLALTAKLEKTSSELTLQYRYVPVNYYVMGNAYLRPNTTTLTARLTQGMLKNSMFLKLNYDYQFSNSVGRTTGFKNHLLTGLLDCKAGDHVQMIAGANLNFNQIRPEGGQANTNRLINSYLTINSDFQAGKSSMQVTGTLNYIHTESAGYDQQQVMGLLNAAIGIGRIAKVELMSAVTYFSASSNSYTYIGGLGVSAQPVKGLKIIVHSKLQHTPLSNNIINVCTANYTFKKVFNISLQYQNQESLSDLSSHHGNHLALISTGVKF
jgi:hypothetical protein